MVCFTYLTLPEDGARSMIVNFHMVGHIVVPSTECAIMYPDLVRDCVLQQAERPTSVFAQLEVEGPARTRESDASKVPDDAHQYIRRALLSVAHILHI